MREGDLISRGVILPVGDHVGIELTLTTTDVFPAAARPSVTFNGVPLPLGEAEGSKGTWRLFHRIPAPGKPPRSGDYSTPTGVFTASALCIPGEGHAPCEMCGLDRAWQNQGGDLVILARSAIVLEDACVVRRHGLQPPGHPHPDGDPLDLLDDWGALETQIDGSWRRWTGPSHENRLIFHQVASVETSVRLHLQPPGLVLCGNDLSLELDGVPGIAVSRRPGRAGTIAEWVFPAQPRPSIARQAVLMLRLAQAPGRRLPGEPSRGMALAGLEVAASLLEMTTPDPRHVRDIFAAEQLATEGHVDGLDDEGRLHGWVRCPAWPRLRLTVGAVTGSRVVATGMANQYRRDVHAAGRGDGRCGFMLDLRHEQGLAGQGILVAIVEAARLISPSPIVVPQAFRMAGRDAFQPS